MSEWITISEYAERAGCSNSAVARRARKGTIERRPVTDEDRERMELHGAVSYLVRWEQSAAADASNIEAPNCVKRERKKVREIRVSTSQMSRATDAIGEIERGVEVFGFTKGQFSLLDLILVALDRTGPADVAIATWTAANAHIQSAQELLRCGEIRSIRWVVDQSFLSRQPEYFENLISRFGPDCVRITNTHAKFVVITNDEWSLAIRTSMNLNGNPRFESFEISDDPTLAGFLLEVVDEIYSNDQAAYSWDEGAKTFETFESSHEVSLLRCAHVNDDGNRCQMRVAKSSTRCPLHRGENVVELDTGFATQGGVFATREENMTWLDRVRRGEIGEIRITPKGDTVEIPASLDTRVKAAKLLEDLRDASPEEDAEALQIVEFVPVREGE